MAKKNWWDPDQEQDQDQDQDQDQKQGEAQGQLQAQLEAQGQLQGQGQAQGQAALQFLAQEAENEADNDAKNESSNEAKNEADNEAKNEASNEAKNEASNEVDNKVENEVENKVDVNTDVKTDVETNVDVSVDLDLSSLPNDEDVIDIDELKIEDLDGIFFMNTDEVDQKADNAYNIDQINNMVDNDDLGNAQVSFSYSGSELKSELDDKNDDGAGSNSVFSMEAHADGGTSRVEGSNAHANDAGRDAEASLNSTADGIASNEAFTQNIVMGANIQFNQIDIATDDGIA